MNYNYLSREAKKQFWEKHLEQWQGSKLTLSSYCKQHDLKESTFRDWREKCTISNDQSLVEIPSQVVQNYISPHSSLEIIINNATIRIPSHFDSQHLKKVIEVLEGTL